MRHVYGAVPPAAANEVSYIVPTSPSGTSAVVMVMDDEGSTTSSATTPVASAPVRSRTSTVNVKAPTICGSPPSSPSADRPMPAGTVPSPSDQLYGGVPPTATSSTLYGSCASAGG